MAKFYLGKKNDVEAIKFQKLLLVLGLTTKHFITKDEDLYLDVDCTRLTGKKIPIPGYPDVNHDELFWGEIPIAVSHEKNNRYEHTFYLSLNEQNFAKLPNDLNKPGAIEQRDKNDALEKYRQAIYAKRDQYREAFVITHKRAFESSRNVWFFGMFRNSNLPFEPSIEVILQHAKKANNRSRQICKNFGWLKSDGCFDNNAPELIKNPNDYIFSNYETLTKELKSALSQDGSQRRLFKELNWLDGTHQLTGSVPQIIRDEFREYGLAAIQTMISSK